MENQESTGAVTRTDQTGVENQKPTKEASLEAGLSFWQQLRWTLILNFILLAVLPVAVVLFIVLTRTSEQATHQVINQLESVATLKQSQLIQWIEDSRLVLQVFLSDSTRANRFRDFAAATLQPSSGEGGGTLPESMGQEQAALNGLLRDTVKAQTFFEEIFLYNAEGQIVAASNEIQLGKIVTRQPYFAESLAGEFVQIPYYEIGKGELTMFITQPLADSQSGRTVGVMAGRLDTSTMGQIMLERAGLGESGETYLVSPESNYLLTPSRFESEGYVLARAYHSQGIDRALRGENGSGTYGDYRDPPIPVIGVYRWLPELKVAMLAEVDEAEALALSEEARNFSLLVAVGAILLAVGVGLYAATRISGPVIGLTQVATRIAGGDLTQRVEIDRRNEIGLLATAFNRMTVQLRELIGSLEQRVAERTQRLEVVAVLGERLSAILEFDQLLNELVNQVKDRFDYYHAHVYIIDEEQQNLVMTAGAGEAGAAMKAKGHRIALDAPASLVARAARSGEIVTVDNVREAEDWLPNPLLPDTYSEMAVPIMVEGQVVGVLDVQEDEMAGLDEGDAGLLRSVANQVAVAMRNARLFEEVQTALAEVRELQRRYVEQAWDRTRVARRGATRVQFSLGESTTLNEATVAEARQQALAQEEPTVVVISGSEQSSAVSRQPLAVSDGEATQHATRNTQHALVAPITLHETPIGNLQLHGVNPNRQWTEAELALINAVVDQVAQAAETLRLLDETQERASREQMIGQVSDKLRRAPDMETLMKTAVAELSRLLGPARTFVRLSSEAELEGPQGTGPANGEPADQAEERLATLAQDPPAEPGENGAAGEKKNGSGD